jgi:DNA-binding YbaB/EbfC family protein
MSEPGDPDDTPGQAGQGQPGPAGVPPAGPASPFDLLASAQEALAAQADAARQTVEGTAGGGVVTVVMTGGGEVTGITLAPEVVDPDDIDMLQDLILAALRDAATKAADLQRHALGALGELDLGSLGGLFGPEPRDTPGPDR